MKQAPLRFVLILFSLSTIIAPAQTQPQGHVTADRRAKRSVGWDPLAVKSLDPSRRSFPDASLIDLSYLLDPPAGKHGFVRVGAKGRLEFQDGTPARFWGVSVAGEHITAPNDVIDEITQTLARAGANLVRLHALDDRGIEQIGKQNIIDEAHPRQMSSRFIDHDFRDRIDYWIGAAKRNGIYVSLGLRMHRTFKENDGIPNADSLGRGARPYAMFKPKLIELQKEFIDSFAIFHANPYSGLTYAEDPSIVCFEIVTDEDILSRPELWRRMPEPYWEEFNDLWNKWLLGRYKSTAGLKAAWTNAAGITALAAGESLEKRNVRLPSMAPLPFDQATLMPYYDPHRSPVRRSDAVRFAIDLQSNFFRAIREHCVQRGIRVPMSAAVSTEIRPMTYSVTRELDLTSGGHVFDQPETLPDGSRAAIPEQSSGRARPMLVSNGIEYFSGKNPILESGSSGLAPMIARHHWSGKPAAIREWRVQWPNAFRGTTPLEVAAYGLFQGVDMITFEGYAVRGDVGSLNGSGIQADPPQWGMFALAAKMFHSGDVREAERTVGVLFSEEDLTTYAGYESPLYELAWMHRVVNVPPPSNGPADTPTAQAFDFSITSGRSQTGHLDGRNGIIFALTPFVDAQKQQLGTERTSIYARSGYPIPMIIMRSDTMISSPVGYPPRLRARWGFRIGDVRSYGFLPFGSDPTGTYCAGFRDTSRNILALGGIPEEQVVSIAAGILNETYGTPTDQEAFRQKVFRSDTRELVRNSEQGYSLISTPNFCSVQGALAVGRRYDAGELSVVSRSPIAAVAATSLDGEPLASSGLILLKMVTIAENTGQVLDTTEVEGTGRRVRIRSRGAFPVTTRGRPILNPTSVWIGGKRTVDVYMENGTWEIVLDRRNGRHLIACDTPNIRFHLFPDKPVRRAALQRVLHYREPLDPEEAKTDFIYAGFNKYVALKELDAP